MDKTTLMQIKLAYGKTGLTIELPDEWDVTIVEPEQVPALPRPEVALQEAPRNPFESRSLREMAQPDQQVGLVFDDITRPTPKQLILTAALEELSHIPKGNITLFNGLGTHRPNTEAELRAMLGDALVDTYRIVQNNAFEPHTQAQLGTTERGHEIWLNRELLECDVKVLTGFIEPHFFAGFSGGGKALMPGLAGLQTIMANHSADMIAHPQATWGVTWGNPSWEEMREVARKAGPSFLINVALNHQKQITGVFAGELDAAHAAGCIFVKKTAMVPVTQPFDVVITTNSGHPLDLNLYQAVKGMSAAAQVVRQKGAIIIAAECADGIPHHGLYGQLLRQAQSPQALLDTIHVPGFLEQDQWQAQIQAQIQLKADVYVYSDHLSDEQIRSTLLEPSHHIEDTTADLLDKYGPYAKICVLPEGPQTIPYIAAE